MDRGNIDRALSNIDGIAWFFRENKYVHSALMEAVSVIQKELGQAEEKGSPLVLDEKTALAIAAGAHAINTNRRLFGASFAWDIHGVNGGPKLISYYDAVKVLYEIADKALGRTEPEG